MRRSVVALLIVIPLAAIVWWVATNSYWAEITVPMPLKGEAARNPFYSVQRFAEKLGAHTRWDRAFTALPTDAVVVLSGWHWSLSARRRERIERWVDGGGRLVVDGMLIGGEEEFERWSGVKQEYREVKETGEDTPPVESKDPCESYQEERGPPASAAPDRRRYWMCYFSTVSFLTTKKEPGWILRGASGIQAVRVQQGQGSVTVINAVPFRYRNLFDGDHGWLFVAATQLRPGETVHFLSEDEHPSLVALAWQRGGPAVILGLAIVLVMVWRNATRFGPLATPEQMARRSLAEQIRGTGQFAWHHGGAESLHAACVRALDEAARRRIAGYDGMSAKDRAAAIGRLTGFDWNALAAAVHHPRSRRSQELRSTIALLEAARRRTLVKSSG